MNKIQLIGNVTKEIELKKSKGGNAYCNFTVATNKKDKTNFFNCVAFSGLAENVLSKYVHKGDKIYVEGDIELEPAENYTNKVSVVVNNIELLGSKKG